jgi:hypothetical protein
MESKVSILSPPVEFTKTDTRFTNWSFMKQMQNDDVSFPLFASESFSAIYSSGKVWTLGDYVKESRW